VQFIFDNHTLDTERRELLRSGAAIAVQPQVFDLSVY
jgi:DNA-binding winged helix-turn-helix (wHTH) protein